MEEFKREMKTLTVKLKEAENRAEQAEKSVKRLQKEVDRLEGAFPLTNLRLFTLPVSEDQLCGNGSVSSWIRHHRCCLITVHSRFTCNLFSILS